MKDTMQEAASDVENTIHTGVTDFEKDWQDATNEAGSSRSNADINAYTRYPTYSHPKKKWRVKQAAVPNWYKARTGVRTKAMSGAARVAKFRPVRLA
jgi:sec-independent protein translocase protein TatB